MHPTITGILDIRRQQPVRPAPPTREMIEALRRQGDGSAFPPLDLRGVPMEDDAPARPAAATGLAALQGVPEWPEGDDCVVQPSERPDRNSPLRFQFQRRYGNVFTNKGCKFIFRTEHLVDIIKLHVEFNKHKPMTSYPLTMSDVVTAALDVVFDHPFSFAGLKDPIEAREVMARAVYRRAFVRFLPVYESI